jgi:hypothetical protein
MAYQKVIPKLKQAATQIYDIHEATELKEMMKEFINRTMAYVKEGTLNSMQKATKAMKFLPKKVNKLKRILDKVDHKHSPHTLALVKVCLDMKEAYYKSCKPLYHLQNLHNILCLQQIIAGKLLDGCNFEVILGQWWLYLIIIH